MRTRIQDNMKMLRAQFRMGIRIGCFSSKCTNLILVPARARAHARLGWHVDPDPGVFATRARITGRSIEREIDI